MARRVDGTLARWLRSLPWRLRPRLLRRPKERAAFRRPGDGSAPRSPAMDRSAHEPPRDHDLIPAVVQALVQLPGVIGELRSLVEGLARAARPDGELTAVLRELAKLLAAAADRLEAGPRA